MMKKISFFRYSVSYRSVFLFLAVLLGSCGGDEGESGDVAIHYDFYFDTNIFDANQLPNSLVSICYTQDLTNCPGSAVTRFFAGEETKLIAMGTDASSPTEQLILEKNLAEQLAGIAVNKAYMDSKLKTDFELYEEFTGLDGVDYSSTDVELFLTDRNISRNHQLFFFSEYSQDDYVTMFSREFQIFHDVETLKDSIAGRVCRGKVERISILYELSFLGGEQNVAGCDCSEEKEVVCGDGILYRNRCKAECAGALNISLGPCDKMVDLEIPVLDEEKIKSEARGFIETFYDYLNEISKGIDVRAEAKSLFLNNGEGVSIQLNNKNSDLIRTVSLDSYLNYLYGLGDKNQTVRIKIGSIQLDQPFEDMMDGDLPMESIMASIEQDYHRYSYVDKKVGKLLYADKTGKGVEIIARLSENPGSGNLEWRVCLSNISVEKKAI